MATIHGTNGKDTIYNPFTLTGSDEIYGHDGDDAIYAWTGNDIVYGGAGADRLYGGAGSDTASYSDSDALVNVSLLTGLGFSGTAQGDTLDSIENLIGSSYSDLLIGNNGANVLEGGSGDDLLHGLAGDDVLEGGGGNDSIDAGAGDDTLHGGTGDDVLWGSAGSDLISGGAGIDTASYTNSGAGVTVMLNVDSAVGGDAEGDELDSIENLTGSDHSDDLWGDDGGNALHGRSGDDRLKGFGGADSILGGSGNDALWGMDGNDLLSGAFGNDVLLGGLGLDMMSGGGGGDSFIWLTAEETSLTAATADLILDFNRGEGDVINLAEVDANVYAAGNQAFTFIGTADFSGTPGEVRYYQSGGNTFIEVQTGTSPDIEGVIRLDGLHSPDASWFVL
jgi:Ca2+-binding RTX toxin-like protein